MMQRYTLDQVAQETGTSPRRIRSWIQKGLVPKGQLAGRYGAYTYAHVQRVREIRDLLEDNRSLADIRDHLNPMFS